QTNAINIANGKIHGSVHNFPGGIPQVGSGGAVGDKAYVESGVNGGKIESGHQLCDPTQSFPDATLPDTGNLVWQAAVPTTFIKDGVTYKYVLNNARPWKIAVLDGSVYVSSPGVKLWVQNDVKFPSSGQILIPTGNTLSMYSTAGNVSIGGNGIINSN